MKFLDDLRENIGYYYVDEEINLNDLVIMIAYVLITVAIIIVEIIMSLEDSDFTRLIITILYVGLSIPFIAHFIGKLSKMLAFKLKRRRFIKNGQCYRGRIVDSLKGKLLFKDSVSGKEKYSYYPVVEVCQGDTIYRFASKSAVNNSDKTALTDRNVTLYCYGEDFILTEVNIAGDFRHSLEYVNAKNKRNYERVETLIVKVSIIFITGFAIIKIISMLIKIVVDFIFK